MTFTIIKLSISGNNKNNNKKHEDNKLSLLPESIKFNAKNI